MRETTTAAQDEVVQICQDLIRIDTSNFGDGSGPGEAEAAAYVVQSLREVGLEPQTFESDPGRVSVVVRIPGADRERGALCIHGHGLAHPVAHRRGPGKELRARNEGGRDQGEGEQRAEEHGAKVGRDAGRYTLRQSAFIVGDFDVGL